MGGEGRGESAPLNIKSWIRQYEGIFL